MMNIVKSKKMISQKKMAVMIAKRGAIDSILRVLTVQDFNKDMVANGTDLLKDLTIAPQNINKIFELKGPEVLINVVNA